MAVKLQETTDRSLQNEINIKKLDGAHEATYKLATSVAVLAEQMKTMNANVTNLTNKVEALEDKPGKRWEAMVDRIIWAVVAAIVAYALAKIGM